MIDAIKQLNELILEANPNDPKQMRLIDAAVYSYFKKRLGGTFIGLPYIPPYSQSLDVLKTITPDAWGWSCRETAEGWNGQLIRFNDLTFVSAIKMKTEELARLSCIMQALGYEQKRSL